jgi:succinate-semialdehyde dehydrogenase
MMITLKGRNAVILAPHPRGEATCAESVRIARAELAKLGAPEAVVTVANMSALRAGMEVGAFVIVRPVS